MIAFLFFPLFLAPIYLRLGNHKLRSMFDIIVGVSDFPCPTLNASISISILFSVNQRFLGSFFYFIARLFGKKMTKKKSLTEIKQSSLYFSTIFIFHFLKFFYKTCKQWEKKNNCCLNVAQSFMLVGVYGVENSVHFYLLSAVSLIVMYTCGKRAPILVSVIAFGYLGARCEPKNLSNGCFTFFCFLKTR
jgi:hypothetical protein